MYTVPPPPFSFVTLLTLIAIFAGSLAMLFVIFHQLTERRHWVGMLEWARGNGFRSVDFDRTQLPQPLAELAPHGRFMLVGKRSLVTQLQTTVVGNDQDVLPEMRRWNVFVRELATPRATAALRPLAHAQSLIDLFPGLQEFRTLAAGHRFSVRATDLNSARQLALGSARALLPADIGLMYFHSWIVLDFSTRPFDPIEFNRMMALVDQLEQI